jgi:glycosyltransferase involved in cell wall biosynthesis
MKISILISLYNAEKTLDQTFESLFCQTLQDFQIVAIDDASTDSTLKKLYSWQEKFGLGRFIIIENQTNLGLTRSLNLGLNNIQTPYTARIDSDDWWEPTKLEQQVLFLDKNPDCGLVGTAYTNHFQKHQSCIHPPLTNDHIRGSIFKKNPFAHSTVVFRTSLVQELGGYDNDVRYGQDYDLWLRLYPKTSYANLSDILCHRNAINTISSHKQREQMLQCVRTQLKYLKLYQKPLLEYRFIFEPLLVALSPDWLRSLKRKLSL